jgi:UDP-N-acetylmuramyl tripeptide synthase
LEILDRRSALKKAVELAVLGDAVVATGKGSEAWIHGKNGEKTPWNERQILEETLKEK